MSAETIIALGAIISAPVTLIAVVIWCIIIGPDDSP